MRKPIAFAVQGRGVRTFPFRHQDVAAMLKEAQVAANAGNTIAIDGRPVKDLRTPVPEGATVVVTRPIQNG